MADQCIVCLEDLDGVPDAIHDDLRDAGAVAEPISKLPTTHPGKIDNEQAIALIKPCGHVLHDECLREWSQKANSCPICRHTFNLVEVLDRVGGKTLVSRIRSLLFSGLSANYFWSAFQCFDSVAATSRPSNPPTGAAIFACGSSADLLSIWEPMLTHLPPGTVLSEYLVEDKKQVAEFDPNAWIEDNLEDEEQATPCPICGAADNEDVLLLCDACDAPYHTYCINPDRVPRGHWFCMECAEDEALATIIESEAPRAQALSVRSQPRTQATVRRTRQRMRTDQWMGAWNAFSNRIHDVVGLDLDFSDDDQNLASYRIHSRRTAAEQREFQQWQQRLNIASRQGARDVFRRAAPVLREPTPVESPEVAQAWGALERAKELDTTSPRSRKRKSRSVTASPAERLEAPKEPERKLKRPRTRRVLDAPGPSSAAAPISTLSRQSNGSSRRESPSRPVHDADGQPSFLTQLLKEVETATSDDDTPRQNIVTAPSIPNGITSPSLDYSSPAASPSPPSSAYHSPRAMSITPPPHITKRPGSPLPLTSRIEPIFPPADYSPNRPASEPSHKTDREHSNTPTLELRQPRPRRQAPVPPARSSETSPVRATMSIEAKEGINKIVKSALAPHWKSSELSKEQYEKINRDISRKLYEIGADHSLTDEKNRCALEKIATEKVATAVKSLTAL